MSTHAPTIVLVHGAFAESASWSPVIECLNHHDTQLVATHQRRVRDVVAVANPLRSLTTCSRRCDWTQVRRRRRSFATTASMSFCSHLFDRCALAP